MKVSLDFVDLDLDLSEITKERVPFMSTPVVYTFDITTKPISRNITILAIRNNSTNVLLVCKILQTSTSQPVKFYRWIQSNP